MLHLSNASTNPPTTSLLQVRVKAHSAPVGATVPPTTTTCQQMFFPCWYAGYHETKSLLMMKKFAHNTILISREDLKTSFDQVRSLNDSDRMLEEAYTRITKNMKLNIG